MKFFLKREVQGAVSILLVVIMVPMMVLSALMVDTARYSLSKSMVASAGDLAMNAALADYDTILKDVYGLFAMSQADDIEENVKQYFEDTLVSYGVVGEEDAGAYVESLLGALYQSLVLDGGEIANFMSMTVDEDNITVTKLDDSSLANAAVLEKQIVEYMKYRGPVDFGLSFLDSLSAFTKVEEQTTVIEAQVKAQEGMQTVANANEVLYKAVGNYDGKYVELQDSAADGFRLKQYGDILLTYRERYAAVHRLTVIFCSTAYRGNKTASKWELDDGDILLLNSGGDYITENSGKYDVSGTRNTAYSGVTYYSKFQSEVDGLWSDEDTRQLQALYSGRIFTANYIGSGYRCFVSEGGQEQAIQDFSAADLFYKKSYSEYKNFLDKLDKYIAAAKQFNTAVDAEISAQQNKVNAANNQIEKQQEKKSDAEQAITDSTANLSNWNYDSYHQELADYEQNLQDMEHASPEDKRELQSANDQILNQISGYFPDGTQDNAAFAQGVIDEKNSATANKEIVENCDKKITEQAVIADRAKESIEDLKKEKEAVANRLQTVLQACRTSVNAYNADLKVYKEYRSAVREWVKSEVSQIAAQFNTIHSNLEAVEALLKAAVDACGPAQTAVNGYLGDVNSWSTANQTYESQSGGEDNFSMTNDADIQSAKDTFDPEDVAELRTKLEEQYNMVHNFLTAINSNFYYMGREQIGSITTAEKVRETIAYSTRGTEIQEWGKNGVTSQASEASIQAWFEYTDSIDPRALENMKQMIQPYPCCKYMNYLHQTFRADNKAADGTAEATQQSSNKSTYETVKSGGAGLISNVEQSGTSGSMPDLGYQYQNVASIGGTGYPSADYQAWIKEISQNTDTSSKGLAANKATVSNLLSGLGNAMETGRDKLLVMSYLFENFSYNTIVQDMAREQHEDLSWPLGIKSEYYTDVLGQAKTSSGIAINGTNNPLYGAEIEYVLFGNSNPQTNVACMKGSIFAVRMLFNSVYAFTNTEIRNTARAVGMSVQAATMGIVPYQIVMVVVQLALALGESAIDMQKMNVGEQVAIVKSGSTWMLSSQGMANLAKAAVAQMATEMIDAGAKALENKIGEIVDAKAEELTTVVQDVGTNLQSYADSAIQETTNRIFVEIETTVENYLNTVAYFDEEELGNDLLAAKAYMIGKVEQAFSDIKSELNTYLSSKKDEDSVEGKVCAALYAGGDQTLNGILDDLQGTIVNEISNADTLELARTCLYKQVYGIRETVSSKLSGLSKAVINKVSTALKSVIADTEKAIKEEANKAVEKGAESAKEAVVKELNGFMDGLSSNGSVFNTGSSNSLANVNGVKNSSGNLATQIKFGYSDYLKLFVFIGLCADDKNSAMICRIGDLIQYNIANAKSGSALQSKAGNKFTMSNAKTYVSIDAAVDLDMMFLNLGIFQKQIESYNAELSEEQQIDLDSGLQVHYIGISGY